jgi:hypothetical protein
MPPKHFPSLRRTALEKNGKLDAAHACNFLFFCHQESAKRQTPNAPSMTRLILAALSLATLVLNGCDNRTREAVRWDQIAEAQKTVKNVQKWPEAESPWSNAEHHTGIAW